MEENEVLGDERGPDQHARHEERIRFLDHNVSMFKYERME